MKFLLTILFGFRCLVCPAQEFEPEDDDPIDDSFLQQLEFYKAHPIDINTADANELKEIIFLSDVEIMNLLSYRKSFGKLISMYELQAVPGWEIGKIKKILPYITISNSMSVKEDLLQRVKNGDHSLLVKWDKGKSFVRYKYRDKDLLQYGVTAKKDFYSFHLFARKIGVIDAIALGDFTVNMGQGLIEWQTAAFSKSMEVMSVKRQSPVLKPYSSAGASDFHRGAGIELHYKKISSTLFFSNKKDEQAVGASISLQWKNFHAGVNAIHYPGEASNVSVDYSGGFRNLHFFGEAATDKQFEMAALNGVLISLAANVDVSIIHRNISSKYRSVYGDAFTESSKPSNENGLFTGISIRLANAWKVNGYVDIYKFPWLKPATHSPVQGKDFLLQVNYIPNKQVEMYSRFKTEVKLPDETTLSNWRMQFNFALDKSTTIRNRVEMSWYNRKRTDAANGFLFFFDVLYKPMLKAWSANFRIQYFEADDYNARLYAYENDVLYSFTVPAFSEKGYRYYINSSFKILRGLSVYMKCSQTIYSTTLDKTGKNKVEIKMEMQWIFGN